MALLLCLAACARSPGETGPAGLLPSSSEVVCASVEADADRDGLDDRCEQALASAFAPELLIDARDCLWRGTAASPPRLDGGYLFAAEWAADGTAIRIAYLPAYFRDCGWSGAACVLRAGRCGAHAGDSELIVVDVVRDRAAGRWRTTGVFLSAHCFGRSDGRCRWYRTEALRDFGWAEARPFGAPRVWVARGKHAHYPSQRACDQGHWSYDSCDDNRVVARFPVLSAAQNIGSRAHPLHSAGGCLTAEALPLGMAGASAGSRECFWQPASPFRGWQADRSGTAPTPYARALEIFAGF